MVPLGRRYRLIGGGWSLGWSWGLGLWVEAPGGCLSVQCKLLCFNGFIAFDWEPMDPAVHP